MVWHRLKLIVVAGMTLIIVALTAGTAVLLDRSQRAALAEAESALERSARAVENALTRQMLQVHGALASLPALLAAARIAPSDSADAALLLRGLNFQTLAYRDLLLVGPDGAVLARARPGGGGQRRLPFDVAALANVPTALLGPVRNPQTGDWSLYVARAAKGWDGVIPVAEVPLATLMNLLAETGIAPGVRIALGRPNGQLIATLPHDETRIGSTPDAAQAKTPADGAAFLATSEGRQVLTVVRASLYDDVRVILTADLSRLLASWRHSRDRTLATAAVTGVLVVAFAAALLLALRQREQAAAEREQSAMVLANAVEAMSDGFAMWDGDDRLVTCNRRYRDLYALSAPFMTPGARFEDVIRQGAEAGQFPQEQADLERAVAAMVAWHRRGAGSLERHLPDGRWVLMKERRTADGGIVGIRTDITALKATLADLAEANARATEAAEEARRQNEALVERERRIRYLAHHDELTGLPNRVLFREHIEAALASAQTQGTRAALLYLDLDRFKDVNDTLGHPAGDALLRCAAERLGSCVADAESVARLSGDEFAVISIAPSQPAAAEELSARIIAALGRPYSLLGRTVTIGVSVGIAVADPHEGDADALLKQADLALYQAKANGRGIACVFAPEMGAHLHARMQMEADLREALAGRQFELAYQPIIALASDRLCGFEALLRWHHPHQGAISPEVFIPVAEEARLIGEIGAFVVRRACQDAASMPEHVKVAINLSPVQLASSDVVAIVGEALRESGIAARRLEFEITETALFANDRATLDTLRHLRALGVRIVLDDFGTGYSSLSHLRLVPLDKIKIDRSFVRDITDRMEGGAIVEAIAALARRLGMTTTAEGIETPAQLAVARAAGCTEAQGHLLGEPLSLARALMQADAARMPRIGA